MNINKVLIGAAGILIVLVAFSLLLSSFLSKKPNESTSSPTPIPTTILNSRGGNPVSSLNDAVREKNKGLLPQQQARLEELKKKLPQSSADFEMDYDSGTDTFFIQLKIDGSEDKLKEYLAQNGLLGVYLGGSNKILVSKDPIPQAILKLRDDLVADLNHGKGSDDDEPTGKTKNTQQEKDAATLDDLSDILFNFEVPTLPPPEPPTGKGTIIGNVMLPPNLGGANNLGYYQMPLPTADEYVFSSGTCPAQRWGQKELIGTIYTVAKAWKARFPDSRLRVGDLNASGHNSHRWGVAVDITITNQSAANTSGDRNRSIELGKMFANTNLIKNIWYCDRAVNSAVLGYARANNLSLQQMSCVSGHNDHFHVDIINPRGPASTPGC